MSVFKVTKPCKGTWNLLPIISQLESIYLKYCMSILALKKKCNEKLRTKVLSSIIKSQ